MVPILDTARARVHCSLVAIKSNDIITDIISRDGVSVFRVDDTDQLRWGQTAAINLIALDPDSEGEWTQAGIDVINSSTPVNMEAIRAKAMLYGVEWARADAERAGDRVTELVLSVESIEDEINREIAEDSADMEASIRFYG